MSFRPVTGGPKMNEGASHVKVSEFVERVEREARAFLESVMQAVNAAPDGEWIEGSEERVRDLAAEFRRRVFEQAVQQRIDAAEAAFPPSAADDRRSGHEAAGEQAAGEQGAAEVDRADGQRPR
jgi:hypothetical protein